ncbi:thioredoxin reductase [Streptomyces griseus]|uniref:Thioredoxin reductase n=1 Tax=Streptomyces griseus TaxID=1911 RepID=A0A380N8D9_STRGR|nr:thioredoxin reductase [Streptomyces griseus]
MLGGVVLRDVFTGATRDLDVTGLFIAIGHDPRTELFTGQLDLDTEGYITVAARRR